MDVSALARLFRNTTTSYKYLFFLSLLGEVQRRGSEGPRVVHLRSLAVEMLVSAWYPTQFFRLSLGCTDQIGALLAKVPFLSRAGGAPADLRQGLRSAIEAESQHLGLAQLLRYVPARVLRPFFDQELRGEPDRTPARERRIQELSQSLFESRRPLYRILGDEKIEVHPAWWFYLAWNLPVVRDWARWHWAAYLQRRNPNVPAVAAKLEAPDRRAELVRQREFWRTVLGGEEFQCIYSCQDLGPNGFELDHFLPWSFVTHDQLWNLIPTVPGINAAKGARIPDVRYVEPLALAQGRALRVARARLPRKRFERIGEEYLLGLRVERMDDLLSPDGLKAAFAKTIEPLRELALRMGFPGPWQYEGVRVAGFAAVAEDPSDGGYGG